jgi:dTDP-4-amino-4,6-dideoxygalactose transaminase
MSVPFYSFNDLDDNVFQEKVLGRFKEIVEAHAFVEGKYNAQFEKNFAEKQKAKHCLLVGNGTDALEIALQAYDVGPGDKVGVPGISFYASAEAIINCGAEVIFIDVDPKTGLMCPESLKRIIKEHKLKAILPVHIYGQPAPIAELEEICGPSDIKIVEDAAQAAGGYLSAGQPIGSSNNLTTFSFYPTKNLSACGDAGAVLTSDDELAEKIISIRNHGRSPNGHALIGRNSLYL